MVEDGAWALSEGGRLKADPDVVAQPLGDGLVLLHMRTDDFYELNRTGAVLWNLLSAGLSPEQIHRQIVREYDVDPVQLAEEMRSMLGELCERALLVADE